MPSCRGMSLRNIRPMLRCSGSIANWVSIRCMPACRVTRGKSSCGASCPRAEKADTVASSAAQPENAKRRKEEVRRENVMERWSCKKNARQDGHFQLHPAKTYFAASVFIAAFLWPLWWCLAFFMVAAGAGAGAAAVIAAAGVATAAGAAVWAKAPTAKKPATRTARSLFMVSSCSKVR